MNKERREEFWKQFYEGTYACVQTHRKTGVKLTCCGMSESQAEIRGQEGIETFSYIIRKTNREDFEENMKSNGK